ncbi:hypothetical protein DYBT9623_05506 [Dyadobacter sp. CECT 9623]|jgi:putative membrane protein|uniref:Uncharacterized protein n=1 Tax=Dyadobacter linearis TaxID=2823330 RepID=A0ABM8UYS8_9BACT|nr:bestrophin family ion channel [Dyadobacter sp. CECT 9623]CAG5074818.1 hypothetical protein DYBT9623_05506 [Dyadobacter sp. CECT 9623]
MIINRKIPFRFLLSEIKKPLIIVIILGIISGILHKYYRNILPEIPIGIATTLGIAISILLSYKINKAYSRWWEARTIWGAIVNDSRSLVLQLQLYLNEQIELIYKISHYQIAWCYSLEKSLRRQDISEVLNSILTIHDIEKVRKHSNTLLAINQLQTPLIKELFKKGFLNEFARIKI